jgi:alpha-tubulin suppressor-like RCC1 family protein
LAANQSVLVTVRYSPGVAGTDNQSVSFTGGGGASRPVSGSAYNPPAIAVTPASQDFGSIQVGTTADQAFTVQNTGGGTLSGSASVSSPFSIVSGSPYSLTANQSVLVTVRYSPGVAGTDNQSILLTGGSGASRPVSGAAFLPTVDTPTISPNGGSYPESVQVTLACTTVGRAIFYTLDGSAPTTGSTPYGGPFTLTSSAPVKAKAFKSGYNDSATASASFTVAAAPPTQLTGMSMTSGLFRFVLNGPVGSDYVIQVSSNLVNWVPLLTNTIPVGGSLIINDPLAAGRPMRFYRAVLVNGQSVGTVVGWGDNSTGQTNLPPGLTNVVAIAAGFHHSLALKPDGTVVGWGENDFGQTNPPAGLSNVAAIAAGWGTSLALKRDGTLEEWGWDGGYGLKATAESLTNIKAIAACWDCFMALRNDNTVFVWGNSTHGETNVPAGLNNVTRIAGGGYFCMALKGDGTVVTWGSNYAGQTNVPGGLDSVAAIAAGGYHCLALKSDGTVVAWGAGTNNTGLNLAFGQSMVPPELTNAVAVSAGYYHSLALRADGTLVAWGLGSSGQTNIPAGLHGVTAISAGGYHNLALVDGSYPMQLSGVNCLPGGQVQFAVSGLAGDVYRVLGSTNLYDWQTIASLANLSGFVQFTDPGAAGRRSLFAE